MQQYLLRQSYRHNLLDKRLVRVSPQHKILYYGQSLEQKQQQIINLIQNKLTDAKHQFVLQTSQLNSVSPLATLERGYSVTTNQQHKVIRSVEQVVIGEIIETQLKSGKVTSQIIEINKKSNSQ